MSVPQAGVTPGRLGLSVAAALLVGSLGSSAANAAFNDVDPENQNAEHIASIQEAGIATGYADGSFRPRDSITRQQAASWIDRGASRVGLDQYQDGIANLILDSTTPTATLASIDIDSPAAGDGGGWVTIQGAVGGVATNAGQGCPCLVRVYVLDEADNVVGTNVLSLHAPSNPPDIVSVPILAVVPIAAGETHSYRIDVQLLDTTAVARLGGAVYAIYSPMAEGDPAQFGEAGHSDPVESIAPEGVAP